MGFPRQVELPGPEGLQVVVGGGGHLLLKNDFIKMIYYLNI